MLNLISNETKPFDFLAFKCKYCFNKTGTKLPPQTLQLLFKISRGFSKEEQKDITPRMLTFFFFTYNIIREKWSD